MSAGVKTLTVAEGEAEMRLDRWLKAHFPDMGFGRMQQALRKGEVRVDGGRAKASQRLRPGQSVRVPPYQPAQAPDEGAGKARRGAKAADPADAAFARDLVIFRNPAILAIAKPPGLAVQGGTGTTRHLDAMLDHLRFEADERPRLVHRLDKDTSGVMLLARDRRTAAKLGRAFKDRRTRKVYWAITVGVPLPKAGTLTLPLAKLGAKGAERVEPDPEHGQSAVTDYAVLENAGTKLALVALWPRTGRTHQLRAHMAAIGCPILGDGKYGGQAAFLDGETVGRSLHLHAREIDVPRDLPDAGARLVAAPPPAFRETLDLFEFDPEAAAAEDPFENF